MLYYIYCIWVKTENGVLRYYGHTENITVRKGKHVNYHKAWVKAGRPEKVSDVAGATRSVYVLDHEDWRMDVVDKIECNTRDEVRNLEGKWILENDCVNMQVAGRTMQQYYKDHKEEKKEYYREYQETNKEQIKEYKKQYRDDHKEELSKKAKQYREDHKEQLKEYNKQYREDHKEKMNQKEKQYRQDHKDEIAAKASKKVTCDICGCVVTKSNIAAHHKSKKCLAAKLSQPITTNAITLPSSP